MKIIKVVTTYQSAVTILAGKLRILADMPDINLHVASSFEDPAEIRKPSGMYHKLNIARSISPLSDVPAVLRMWRLFRRERFDIVHTHTAKAGFVGAVAGWLAGVPVVHTYHGLPFYDGQSKKAYLLYKWLEIGACSLRKMVFSQNHRDYEILKKMKSIRCPVVFENNGVCISELQESARQHNGEVEKLFEPGYVHMACLARLEPVKRLKTIIDAICFLAKQEIKAKCIIAGKGPLHEELLGYIKSQQAEDRIKIIYTPHIHALIDRSDIAVLSSEKEGIPRGLMESMALGKPVVATNVPGTDELVVHGETGLLVALGDQNAFNEALLKLCCDESLRKRYGEAGARRIAERFDDGAIVKIWLEKYERVLGRL